MPGGKDDEVLHSPRERERREGRKSSSTTSRKTASSNNCNARGAHIHAPRIDTGVCASTREMSSNYALGVTRRAMRDLGSRAREQVFKAAWKAEGASPRCRKVSRILTCE